MPWSVEEVERWAVDKHRSINHVRPHSDEPYEVHLGEVVALIKSVPHTPRMVAGGWLHDVIDDIPGVMVETVAELTDWSVASLVDSLSDHEMGQGTRKERKAAERERIADADWETQTVRVADVISNVRTIAQRNPKFALVYVQEKEALLAVLVNGDPTLHAMACQAVAEAKAYLDTVAELGRCTVAFVSGEEMVPITDEMVRSVAAVFGPHSAAATAIKDAEAKRAAGFEVQFLKQGSVIVVASRPATDQAPAPTK